jgi:tetratricopeptide (TPR) repeat protein
MTPSSAAANETRKRRVTTATPAEVAEEWLRLGSRAAVEGNREDARYYFVQAVRSDMDNPRAWLYLGGVADDPALTLSCMQKVLQLDPTNLTARNGLTWARNRLGLLPPPPTAGVGVPLPFDGDTLAAMPPAPPRPPDTTESLLRRGIHAANEGEVSRARYYFLKAIAMNGNNLRAWLYLAGVVGDPALTLAALEHVLDYEPSNQAAYKGTLWARNRLGLTAVGPHSWEL